MKALTLLSFILVCFFPWDGTARGILPVQGVQWNRLLLVHGGSSPSDAKDKVLLRVQLPNGKVERLEFQSSDSLSKIASELQLQYKENPSYFKSTKLRDYSIEIQGKLYTLDELTKLTEEILGDKKFRTGEWVVLKLPSSSSSTSPSSSKASATKSKGTASSSKRGKFQSFADIEKYKQSLFKFSKKRDKTESLPIIQLPSSLMASQKALFDEGGIQILFGFTHNSSDATSSYGSSERSFHHIVGSYNFLTGDLLTFNAEEPNYLTTLFDKQNPDGLAAKIQTLQSLLQSCNLKILGISICTHRKQNPSSSNGKTKRGSDTDISPVSTWNSIMFHVSTTIAQLLQTKDLLVISISPKADVADDTNNQKTKKAKSKNRLTTSEEFVLEGYRLDHQSYELLEGNYLQPIYTHKESQSALNKVFLTKSILLGSEEVEELDVSLLSKPLPIESIPSDDANVKDAVITFRQYFPSPEQFIQNKHDPKYEKKLQAFIRDLLQNLSKVKMNHQNQNQEVRKVLEELRDVELLLYLSSSTSLTPVKLSPTIMKSLIKDFVQYDRKELEFIHHSYTRKYRQQLQAKQDKKSNNMGKPKKVANGKEEETKTTEIKENPLLGKTVPKRLQMELSMVLQTMKKDKVVYQGETRSRKRLDDEDDDL